MTAVKRGAIGSDFPKFKVALVYVCGLLPGPVGDP